MVVDGPTAPLVGRAWVSELKAAEMFCSGGMGETPGSDGRDGITAGVAAGDLAAAGLTAEAAPAPKAAR